MRWFRDSTPLLRSQYIPIRMKTQEGSVYMCVCVCVCVGYAPVGLAVWVSFIFNDLICVDKH